MPGRSGKGSRGAGYVAPALTRLGRTSWKYPSQFWGTPRPAAERMGEGLARKLGCAAPATAPSCLRAKPAAAMLDPKPRRRSRGRD